MKRVATRESKILTNKKERAMLARMRVDARYMTELARNRIVKSNIVNTPPRDDNGLKKINNPCHDRPKRLKHLLNLGGSALVRKSEAMSVVEICVILIAP